MGTNPVAVPVVAVMVALDAVAEVGEDVGVVVVSPKTRPRLHQASLILAPRMDGQKNGVAVTVIGRGVTLHTKLITAGDPPTPMLIWLLQA